MDAPAQAHAPATLRVAPPPEAARDLAAFLREAHRRCAGLPAGERRRAVELCLAYRLRGADREGAKALLEGTPQALEAGKKSRAPGAGHPGAGRVSAASSAVLRDILGRVLGEAGAPDREGPEAFARAAEELARVEEHLTLAKPRVPAGSPLGERVGELQERLAGVDRALEQTAQEFLDRLLDAFDPEAAKAYVGQKGLKPSAFYKASVYDALCEKFAQLREYHRRGRLVRDFRATFKNHLKRHDPTP